MKTYKPLTVGDIRREGDEVRRRDDGTYPESFVREYNSEFKSRPVSLIGFPILKADLVVDEFRRPVEVMEE